VAEVVRTGGCLCGAVRYSVRGEPFHVGCCHCGDCRKRSGSAYAIYAHWPRAAFEATGDYASYDGDSFCPVCGSRLFLIEDDAVELSLGPLNDPPFRLRPEAELWIKRREPWIPEVEGASQHRENRG
jgi:hypothetical protein